MKNGQFRIPLLQYLEDKSATMAKLVQYILVRHDLLKDMQWPVGAFVAQACHATTAVMQLFKDDPNTKAYLADLENMHKVVLEIPNEKALTDVGKTLGDNSIDHIVWIEQPENIPTCIALKPYYKEDVKKYLGKYKLYSHTIID